MDIDKWTVDGSRLSDAEWRLLRTTLEDVSPLIVEHRFYRGSRAPHRFVCDDADSLERYVREKAVAGLTTIIC